MPVLQNAQSQNPFARSNRPLYDGGMGYGGYGSGPMESSYGSDVPAYAKNGMGSEGGGSDFDWKGAAPAFGSIASGLSTLFGSDPYEAAVDKYRNRNKQARGLIDPFYQQGRKSLGDYRGYLDRMKDPSGYINSLLQGYTMSPYAQNLQRQAMRGATNAASASGLTGSTPFMQESARTAGNIASQDQERWLQDVLGVDTRYGQGLQYSMGSGQRAGESEAEYLDRLGKEEGAGAYGSAERENQGWGDLAGGAAQLLPYLLM